MICIEPVWILGGDEVFTSSVIIETVFPPAIVYFPALHAFLMLAFYSAGLVSLVDDSWDQPLGCVSDMAAPKLGPPLISWQRAIVIGFTIENLIFQALKLLQ